MNDNILIKKDIPLLGLEAGDILVYNETTSRFRLSRTIMADNDYVFWTYSLSEVIELPFRFLAPYIYSGLAHMYEDVDINEDEDKDTVFTDPSASWYADINDYTDKAWYVPTEQEVAEARKIIIRSYIYNN